MLILAGIISFILIAFDQIAKYFALTRLKPIGSTTIIDGVMNFTFVKNPGAAFGILSGQRWLFILITIVVTTGIIYVFLRLPKNKPNNWMRVALLLVFAGAIGNMIDRIFRGYVVDFLEFRFFEFPVFNIADIYVVTGTALLVFLMLFVLKDEPTKEENNK